VNETQHPAATAATPAPLAKRLAALCYDTLLLAALMFLYTLVVVALRGGRAVNAGTVWFELSLVGVAIAFFCGFWTHGGQTLGMRAWRIRLVRPDAQRITWPQALLRFFAAWLAAVPLGVGYWWSLFDAERRCWHDRIAGTRVDSERPTSA
jgi:uncharacterized RDD family membrane protein YckC